MNPTIDKDLEYLESIVRKHKSKAQHRQLYKLTIASVLFFGLGMVFMGVVISQEIQALNNKITALEAITLKTSAQRHARAPNKLL